MDASELAAKMLQWEEVKRSLDALTEEIQAAVLAIGKTQTVGNVRASFAAGRKTYDYSAAWRAAYGDTEPPADFAKVTYDYRAACYAEDLEAPCTQGEPSVTVKLL